MIWTTAAPAVTTAFLSSLVEAVEALTIVLAVAFVRGWRPAGIGAFVGLALLVLMVLALGSLLERIPLHLMQLFIAVLLLLFGMRWLRKAILRPAGAIPLHDEAIAFATETEELREQARRHETRLEWLAGLATFKAVVLEGGEGRRDLAQHRLRKSHGGKGERYRPGDNGLGVTRRPALCFGAIKE